MCSEEDSIIKIHEIVGYALRNYVLETPVGFIAIDTGHESGLDAFDKRFRKLAPLQELKYIFLTLAHDDHAGFLGALLKLCPAQVVLHPWGIPVLEQGENLILHGVGYSNRFAASTFGRMKKDFRFLPVTLVDRAIHVNSEEDQFFHTLGLPLDILFLPGHTAMNAGISLGCHTIWIDDVIQFQAS